MLFFKNLNLQMKIQIFVKPCNVLITALFNSRMFLHFRELKKFSRNKKRCKSCWIICLWRKHDKFSFLVTIFVVIIFFLGRKYKQFKINNFFFARWWKIGSTSPWSWIDSSCGCSPWPVLAEPAESFSKPLLYTTRGFLSTNSSLKSPRESRIYYPRITNHKH